MTRKPSKIRKLVRLNEFHEELASDSVRQRLAEEAEARDAHGAAEAAVEALGAWKSRAQADGGLDIGLYQLALNAERQAMAHCESLRTALSESVQRTGAAQERWRDAAAATRVSSQRDRRERLALAALEEKRTFDQLGDLLLSRKETSHD
jgi:hypothetical protein